MRMHLVYHENMARARRLAEYFCFSPAGKCVIMKSPGAARPNTRQAGNAMFELLRREGRARRGRMTTVHGVIETPVFMNVGTSGAIRGGASSADLEEIGCQVELSNTYHLHVRPGDELIARMGGLRAFMDWKGPLLTDSGGFQVFSLAKIRRISEEGVAFQSHLDGRALFIGPKESMRIQSHLGSTIAMAFDECIALPAERGYVEQSIERTTRWLAICRDELARLNAQEGTINPHQLLFGINQGGTYADLRIRHMQQIAALDLPGYAIGGLSVGESAQEMYDTIDAVEPYMPADKPRYLMGVGTPLNILEGVYRGVDFFDCVLPLRAAQHGNVFTWEGRRRLSAARYADDPRPIEEGCPCPACRRYSRAYIRHLIKADERLGMRLCILHNLYFYNELTRRIRQALDEGTFTAFYTRWRDVLDEREDGGRWGGRLSEKGASPNPTRKAL